MSLCMWIYISVQCACSGCCCCCFCCCPRLQHLKLWFFAFKFQVNKISVCKLLMLFMQSHPNEQKQKKMNEINFYTANECENMMWRKKIKSSKRINCNKICMLLLLLPLLGLELELWTQFYEVTFRFCSAYVYVRLHLCIRFSFYSTFLTT